ncbi:hypothetical protein PSQ19_06670 [Devosia algicola]|uniref:VWA domain-containing protein n=1 Tax=Devosia algicola TaxID=3026418 RepID=A0ABY7YRH0_9HYPH|nr:hypothetical protein [Devosia algicola]WDR03733.1 hypothetical protein PSQ19_06670 [Devosia algicola]
MGLFRNLMIGVLLIIAAAMPSFAAERAIIVLDGSGSMWAQIDGKARITIARETLASVLKDIPADLELGFMSLWASGKGQL